MSNSLLQYKELIIGAATVLISITGSWEAINAKMAEIDKRVSLVEQQVSMIQSSDAKQDAVIEEIRDMFVRIDKNLTEMNGKLALKADKKFVN